MSTMLLYELIFSISMFVAIWAALVIWRRRHAPGGTPLFWMMLATLEWNFTGLMQVVVHEMEDMIFWSKLAYFGSMSAQLLFFLFILEYTQNEKWLTRRNIALLFMMPGFTFLLAATNEWHGLIWSGYSPSPDGINMIYHHGLWFWVLIAYINSIMFLGSWLLFRFIVHSRDLYRRHNIALVIATLFPWAAMIIYVSGTNPFPGMDLIAISFTFTGVILVFIVTRLSFLDIVPVARELLVDHMLDGLLVLDQYHRIIDINPSAMTIFNVKPGTRWIGLPISALLRDYPELEQHLKTGETLQMEWAQTFPQSRHFDVQIFHLHDRANRLSGKSVILRDITIRITVERELQDANHQLQEKLAQIEKLQKDLREQSIHDALTGLFNRRYIEEIFSNEIARAERGNYALSLIVIDLDHFKDINDTWGHARGDEFLRALGAAFRAHFRASDIPCRFGGDEFILLMPHSSPEDALQRVELFRPVFKRILTEQYQDVPVVTFSAGIASCPVHAKTRDEIFRVADQALYQAKALGRDQTYLPIF